MIKMMPEREPRPPFEVPEDKPEGYLDSEPSGEVQQIMEALESDELNKAIVKGGIQETGSAYISAVVQNNNGTLRWIPADDTHEELKIRSSIEQDPEWLSQIRFAIDSSDIQKRGWEPRNGIQIPTKWERVSPQGQANIAEAIERLQRENSG